MTDLTVELRLARGRARKGEGVGWLGDGTPKLFVSLAATQKIELIESLFARIPPDLVQEQRAGAQGGAFRVEADKVEQEPTLGAPRGIGKRVEDAEGVRGEAEAEKT